MLRLAEIHVACFIRDYNIDRILCTLWLIRGYTLYMIFWTNIYWTHVYNITVLHPWRESFCHIFKDLQIYSWISINCKDLTRSLKVCAKILKNPQCMFLPGSVRPSKDLQRFSSRCCRISFKDLTRSLRVLATCKILKNPCCSCQDL